MSSSQGSQYDWKTYLVLRLVLYHPASCLNWLTSWEDAVSCDLYSRHCFAFHLHVSRIEEYTDNNNNLIYVLLASSNVFCSIKLEEVSTISTQIVCCPYKMVHLKKREKRKENYTCTQILGITFIYTQFNPHRTYEICVLLWILLPKTETALHLLPCGRRLGHLWGNPFAVKVII